MEVEQNKTLIKYLYIFRRARAGGREGGERTRNGRRMWRKKERGGAAAEARERRQQQQHPSPGWVGKSCRAKVKEKVS